MKLAIGFITYNEASSKYLAYFLPSLKKALNFLSPDQFSIMAFDNSDEKKNVNRLALEFFEYRENLAIKYISRDKNIGFGAAYNIIIKEANKLNCQYFLLINPDTILEENTILELIKTLDRDKELAATSPKILRWDFVNQLKTRQIDSCGLVLRPGLKFKDLGQGKIDKGQFEKSKIVAPSGAAGLFRLSALERVKEDGNYFDPVFFMYKEDCDLAYRLKIAGLKAKLSNKSILYHDRTTAFYGRGIISFILNRKSQNRKIKKWSFYNQHLIYIKYFAKESIYSQTVVISRILLYFIFSLILEQYNLKLYKKLWKRQTID